MEDNELAPIAENHNKGFYYDMSDEQLFAGANRTIREVFDWLEATNKFVYECQTPEERERIKKAKNMEWV